MKKKKLKVISVSISLILALAIIFLASIIISRNINYKRSIDEAILPYTITNDINYKVLVEESDYYDSIIDENNNYISSIINKINLSFRYKLNSPSPMLSKIHYKITSRLIINNKVDISTTSLIDEEKVLVEKDLTSNDNIDINETLESDYKYYYDYVQNYKKNYPLLGLEAKIIYTFNVVTNSRYEEVYNVDNSNSSITIPLLDKVIQIKKATINDYNKNIYQTKEVPLINNVFSFFLGIIIFIIGLLLLIPLFMAIRLVNKQQAFRREINHYLKVYDEIIVSASNNIDVTNKEIIEITNFYDLVDVEQELHIPIVFTEVIYNKEAWFTVSNNNQIWRYILKNKNIS